MNFKDMGPEDVFGIRYLPDSHKLLSVLDHMWRVKRRDEPLKHTYYWDATHFGLEKVGAFNEANEEQRLHILEALSRFYPTESFFIERGGFTYNAKMMALVESVEEKSLYAMFASDEANHLRYFANALAEPPTDEYKRNPLLLFLSDVLAQADKRSAVFVVQVMLEGFGIAHYHRLAENCREPVLQEQLERIVRDEAFHHGSGMVLTKAEPVDTKLAREFVAKMVHSLQDWPHAILGAMDLGLGGIAHATKRKILKDLDYDAKTTRRLQQVRSLLQQAAPPDLLQVLDDASAFNGISADECLKHETPDLLRR